MAVAAQAVGPPPPLELGDLCAASFLHDICVHGETALVGELTVRGGGLQDGFWGRTLDTTADRVVTHGRRVPFAVVLSDNCSILTALGMQPGMGGQPRSNRRIWFAPLESAKRRDYDAASTHLNFGRYAVPPQAFTPLVHGSWYENQIIAIRKAFAVDAPTVSAALTTGNFVEAHLDRALQEELRGFWAAEAARVGMIITQENAEKFGAELDKHVSQNLSDAVKETLQRVGESSWGFAQVALEHAGDPQAAMWQPSLEVASLTTSLQQLRDDADAALEALQKMPPLP